MLVCMVLESVTNRLVRASAVIITNKTMNKTSVSGKTFKTCILKSLRRNVGCVHHSTEDNNHMPSCANGIPGVGTMIDQTRNFSVHTR
jgi:hypothetical protein